jgi:hypothetical protein
VLELDGEFFLECCCGGVSVDEAVGPGLDTDMEGGLPLVLFFDADGEGDAPAMAAASERDRSVGAPCWLGPVDAAFNELALPKEI